MMRNQNTPIATEGYPFIAGAAFVTIVAALLSWVPLAVTGFLVTVFTVFFFRNPARVIPDDPGSVISPADGVIIYLGDAHEEHLGEGMRKISIFMSVFNVHINRTPVTGRVIDTFYKKGKFLDVRDDRATFENEQRGLILEAEGGARLVVVQVAGLIARRIVCYLEKGDNTIKGTRYGLIRFGSRLDVYLPKAATLKVSLGDKSVAGETILGYLP
jgi:phosphatidylserine decarboxylase